MKYRYEGDVSVSDRVCKCVPQGQGKVTAYEEDGVTVSWTYEGAFDKGRMTGQGTTTYGEQYRDDPDLAGDVYRGAHLEGDAHGQGTWYRSDGTKKYVGDFQNGEYHGQGTSYRHDGNIREDGAREDGTQEYDGQWKKDCWCGRGILYRRDGATSRNGQWVNGGSEEYEWEEGEEMYWYEGDWDDDGYMHGWGILYRPDRTTVEREGWWQNGGRSDGPPPDRPDAP